MIAKHFPALTYRDFRIFWIGQFASLIGTWMQSTVQPYLAYRISSQPFDLGLIGFASAIPAFFLMLPGGVLIERWNKRKTVIVLQSIMMLQAFTLAILTFTGVVTIWHIIILAFILGSASSLEVTARQSMFIQLVDKPVLPNAIALNSMVFNTARVIGPSLSAPFLLLLGDSGEGWAFLFNGVSYLFVLVGLFLIREKPQETLQKPVSIQDFIEGQQFIRQTPIVLAIIMMVAIPSLFGFAFSQQIPVFARDVLAVAGEAANAAAGRNSMLMATMGTGALIAALYLAVNSTIKRKAFVLTIGQFVYATGLILFSISRSIALSLPAIAMVGYGMVTQLTLSNTLIQISVPDHMRGRVISTYFWVQQSLLPFGSLLLGTLAQNLGAPAAIGIGGTVCALGYGLFHLTHPAIRRTVVEPG